MGFMEMQVFKGDGWEVETDNGSVASPDWDAPDLDEIRAAIGTEKRIFLGDLGACEIHSVTYLSAKTTWWGRYSAPGYLDCTDWNHDTSRRRLERDLRAMYGDAD